MSSLIEDDLRLIARQIREIANYAERTSHIGQRRYALTFVSEELEEIAKFADRTLIYLQRS